MTFAPRAGKDALSVFSECFGAPRALVGMLHLGALPGTPSASQPVETLIQQAVTEARIYRDAGFTALAIENMHDRPYLKGGVGPEITAAMTVLAREVKRETDSCWAFRCSQPRIARRSPLRTRPVRTSCGSKGSCMRTSPTKA